MVDIQRQRFWRAAVSMLLFCAGVPTVLFACERALAEVDTESVASCKVFECVRDGGSLEEAMNDAAFVRMSGDAFPEWFTREVLDPTMIQECYASDGFDAVFVSVRSKEGNFAEMRSLFEGRGWSVMTDDEKGMMSLVKDEGECTWMTVSAREVESGWDAVLRIKRDSCGTNGCLRVGGGL